MLFYFMKFVMEGIVYCDCGTCLFLLHTTRRLNKERYDVSTFHFFTEKMDQTGELGTVALKIREPTIKPKIA